MNINELKQVIIDQHEWPITENRLMRHNDQLIQSFINNPHAVVVSGVRRCGKSTLLGHLRQSIIKSSNFINFDDERLAAFTVADFQLLWECFLELYGEQDTFFFDEIQNVPEWERFVRRLHDNKKKVFITGSNAQMFSKELGTRLTGRYIDLKMFPYSFAEFYHLEEALKINFSQLTTNKRMAIKRKFNEYYKLGGFPEYVEHQKPEYLHTLYENILYRDIIVRYKLTRENLIKALTYFLASNIGKEVTYNSIRKLLGFGSANTVSDYFGYLEASFLCFFVNRFDYSLKVQNNSPKKCYFIDHALANLLGFRMSEDLGRFLENIVFIELKRRYAEVYYHRKEKECDFVVRQGNKITEAIQVSTTLDNPETRQREYMGLLEALSMYSLKKGLILTENTEEEHTVSHLGKSYKIVVMPIWRWALALPTE